MNEERRREEDKRLDEISETVKEIRTILQSENGVCVRLSVCERSVVATQKELEDHKETHKEIKENGFRIWDIGLVLGELILGVLMWFKK
jgi:2,4-dienoyl-CoA reductase-like NADH-dependent reductase (Old Yellow Enzyme family)